jgi:glycosyltransferase involved in cell wall biosynthesis
MKPALTVSIPAHNEERYIGRCIEAAFMSAEQAKAPIEVVVALNRCTDGTQRIAESLGAQCVEEHSKCIARIRNAAVRGGTAEAICTIDADSWMAPEAVGEVLRLVHDPRIVGGGSAMWPERWSMGIFLTGMMVLPHALKERVSVGMFWTKRATFEELGGFDERLISVEDIDFGRRMKRLGKARGQKYGTVWKGGIRTSCRKFDAFGDWYLVKNPQLVRRIFTGNDREAADLYYYEVDRKRFDAEQK